MATNGAGGAESGTYPESLIPTDGSSILSQPPKDKDSMDKNLPMNLYTAPPGIQAGFAPGDHRSCGRRPAVAPAVEKNGTYINWEGCPRSLRPGTLR